MTILAEACCNWFDIAGARDLIRVSHDCGAALTKFQLFSAESDRGTPHYAWVKAHELTYENASTLFDYGASIGQEVFFSVFGAQYVDWCERIGVKRYKLAAGFRDKATWAAVAATGKPCIVSSRNGIPNVPDGQDWDDIIPRIQWLFCPLGYPSLPFKMPDFECGAGMYDGFSDHSLTLTPTKVAIARGARIVERHFVLNHCDDFPDDRWSSPPSDLQYLVQWEREVKEMIIGVS